MFRFPWGDFHSLNLGWFLQKFNELREDWATAEAGIDGALDTEIQKAEDALTDVFAARDAAAASASAANSSAQNASSSALNASQSSIASMNARDAARQAATNAAASESAATASETAAAGSATAAAASETAAGNSATAAAASETAAAASETAAGNSATAAAASETAAAASAAAAEEVEQSIPEDYTTLSSSVDNLKSSFGAFPYSDLLRDEKFVDTRSGRRVEIYRNKIQITKTGSGSTWLWYSLIPGRYVASTASYPNSAVIDDDFVPFNPTGATPYFIRWVKQLPNTTQDNIFIATKDSEGNVTWANLQNTSGIYLRINNMITSLPAILTNGNFALFYRTTDANYENTIEWYIGIEPSGSTSICNFIETTFTASRNYSNNQFILIYGRLYKVTQAITTGEALIANTNIVATSLAQEITSLM